MKATIINHQIENLQACLSKVVITLLLKANIFIHFIRTNTYLSLLLYSFLRRQQQGTPTVDQASTQNFSILKTSLKILHIRAQNVKHQKIGVCEYLKLSYNFHILNFETFIYNFHILFNSVIELTKHYQKIQIFLQRFSSASCCQLCNHKIEAKM